MSMIGDPTLGTLNGKVAIVTASTRGIGFAIAKRLASDGACVVVSSRKENNVRNAVETLKNLGFQNVVGCVCHVANAEERSKLYSKALESFGRIDILVSNAAVNPGFNYTTLNLPEPMWDKIFEINVKCAFLLTKEVASYLIKNNGGHIVYITSFAAYTPSAFPYDSNYFVHQKHFFPRKGVHNGAEKFSMGAYSVSKTALLGLTKVFAAELASSNIRVNCVAPGAINTEFSNAVRNHEILHQDTTNKILMKRYGEPDEVSGTVAFLCSDDAKYITAETIVVGGGITSRL